MASLVCGSCLPVLYERIPADLASCERCQGGFTTTHPKMHCRMCDQTTCPKCYSTTFWLIAALQNRVCDRCYSKWERENIFEKKHLPVLVKGIIASKIGKQGPIPGFFGLSTSQKTFVWKSAELQNNEPKERDELTLRCISGVWEGQSAQKGGGKSGEKCFTLVSKEEGGGGVLGGLMGGKKDRTLIVECANRAEQVKIREAIQEAVAILKPKHEQGKEDEEAARKRAEEYASKKKDRDKRKKEMMADVKGLNTVARIKMERAMRT